MAGRYKAYLEYKQPDIKFVNDIPTHWVISKVRHISTFGRGLPITKANLQDTGIPCVSYGEVHSKFGFEVDPSKHALKCVSEEYLASSPYALLSKGDFVFADTSEDIDGSGNFTQLVSDETLFAGYHTVIVRPSPANYYRFVAYLFDSPEFRTQVRDAVKGVKVFSVTQAILKNASVWLPSFEEQQKIANFLDHETAKIDTLIAKQEKLIELLKEKRQAVISHAVTKGLNPQAPMKDSGVEWLGEVPEHWEVTRAKFVSKIFVPQRNKPELNSNNIGTPWATMDDMKSDFILSTHHTVSDEALKSAGSKVLPKGSVIASCVGNFGVASINKIDVVINQQLQAYIPKRISSLYLRELVSISKCYFELVGTAATLVYVNQQGFENLPITLPSIEEQQDITDYLTAQKGKFDKLIGKCFNQVELMKERKTALISAAVTGKIDVRDWQPQGVQG
ncbi:restriction endonuclease subunit S [Vibrio cholerae]|uniref:restriction endonuclease subunit S n=1 Tax=Vibrio cholerae TaxID=666 RepID=UPI0011D76ABA|nr:restriction endonuclease subunit S [Vibrio cholerae]TXY09110.1 restriction endonuclease subunit S [Vibrio cholerae]GHY40799.1 restriction endonuclease subunit S [Vibrio cholerae]HDL9426543.1 restriction endonuclease subunit S [Vibrio cholerae]